ncbi:MAG: porin [Marinospirillum sp.]|uniref:porin n=1 Tax=Marinospirillum sp. TaxID=2183934 RepID=UPI0019F8D69D|nr:porin [Marinospirillum sp.]MBE0505710.1 porin [Marinospirillum sp.]
MKKTLLASAVAATLAATSVQAATIAQTDTAKVDMYGRINLMLENNDGDNAIKNNTSRIGFRASDKINEDLTAFARAEFRFSADERQESKNGDPVFNDLRNTYVGLQGGFGKVTVGNFDSLYYQAVSNVADLFENKGFRALNKGDSNARGDTIAFETADLGGMQFGLSAKHAPETDASDEAFGLQAYGQFTMVDNLTLAIAFDQNIEELDGGADSDPIIGASATYKMDALKASLLIESSGDFMHIAAGGSYTYGPGDVYGLVSMMDDGNESGLDLAIGANYKLSRAFRTYGEFAMGNDKNNEDYTLGDKSVMTVGMRYDW